MSQLFKKSLEPLKIYRKLKGGENNFSIPPISPWPAQYHDMKLGHVVSKIRQEIKKNKLPVSDMVELAKINFVVDVRKYQSDRILLGFQEFKRVNGHCKLPVNYVIPNTNDFPECVRGLKLGSIQYTMRQHHDRHETIRDAVSDLGFNLIAKEINSPDFPRTLSGLVAYKAIHGDVNIAQNFVVPHGDARYPENTWGMKLGKTLSGVRCQGAWSEHRAQLEALGVSFEVKPVRNEPFDVIFSALESYKAIHGNVNIVYDFVVPDDDARYPEITWGMKLGQKLSKIRCGDAWSEHRAQLEALGVSFEVKPVRNEPFDVIYSALESYKVIHGDVNIAQDFVVPHGDARYPENTWGMKLGSNLHNIRYNGAWSEHRAQLEALGVNYVVKPIKKNAKAKY